MKYVKLKNNWSVAAIVEASRRRITLVEDSKMLYPYVKSLPVLKSRKLKQAPDLPEISGKSADAYGRVAKFTVVPTGDETESISKYPFTVTILPILV